MSHHGKRVEAAAEVWAAATDDAIKLLAEAKRAAAHHPAHRPWQLVDHAIARLGADYADWVDGGLGRLPGLAELPAECWQTREAPESVAAARQWAEDSRRELAVVEAAERGAEDAMASARRQLYAAAAEEAASSIVDEAGQRDPEAYARGCRHGRAIIEVIEQLEELEEIADCYGRLFGGARAAGEPGRSGITYAGAASEAARYAGVCQTLSVEIERATGRA